MDIPKYRELKVWQKAHQLALDTIRLVQNVPTKPGLNRIIDQAIGAVTSIAANIAEGNSSRKGREYIRYLEIALRSATEFDNWVQLIKDSPEINVHVDPALLGVIGNTTIEVLKMLIKMIHSLEEKRGDDGHKVSELLADYFC